MGPGSTAEEIREDAFTNAYIFCHCDDFMKERIMHCSLTTETWSTLLNYWEPLPR